eukprot:762171-Prorocentrum_minimum.AAC.7
MWGRLDGIKSAVKEGFSEFSRDALKESGSIIRDTAKEAAQAAPVVAATASKARSVATHAIAAATDKRKNNQKDSAGLSQKELTDVEDTSGKTSSKDSKTPSQRESASRREKEENEASQPSSSSNAAGGKTACDKHGSVEVLLSVHKAHNAECEGVWQPLCLRLFAPPTSLASVCTSYLPCKIHHESSSRCRLSRKPSEFSAALSPYKSSKSSSAFTPCTM